MQFLPSRPTATTIPPEVSKYKSLVSDLYDVEKVEIAMKFYNDEISKTPKIYPDEFKISSNTGLVIRSIEKHANLFFNSQDKTELLFKFLERSFKYYKGNKKTNSSIFSIIIKTTEKDDPQILKYGSEFLQTALENTLFYTYMFTKERLAKVFQNCFCFFPNTILFYGPLILSATSRRVFTNISNLTQFMEVVTNLLHDGNLEPKSSLSAFTFIGLIIRSLDTGNFLPEILPYIVELAPLCDSLIFYQHFLNAPISNKHIVWKSLHDILIDSHITTELMNTAIIAIDQSGAVPPAENFTLKPFLQKYGTFTKDQQKLLLNFVKKCPNEIKADFISSSMPISKTKIDANVLLEICKNTNFGGLIPTILENFVVKPDFSEFETCGGGVFEVIQHLIKHSNDDFQPSVGLFEATMKIAINNWNNVTSIILDCIFLKMNAATFMPSLISFLKNGLPEPILEWLSQSLFFHCFVHCFLENDGGSTFPTLMKTKRGRDLIARLAYLRPNDTIENYFVQNPPLDLSEKEIDLLMHGLPHDAEDISNGYLCIPSLIPFVSSFTLKTPLEKFIVGKAVGRFFLPLRDQIKQFVSTYFSSTLLRYQITDPDFLPHITDPNLPHFNVLQSVPIEMAKPSKFKRSTSFGFWFNIFELKKTTTTIVSFNEGSLKIDGNSYARIAGEIMFCSPKQWHFVVIITTDNNMTFYIDKKLFTSYQMTPGIPFFAFGNSGNNSMIYFLSPYLRLSGSPFTQEQIESFFTMGPNSPTNVLIEPSNGVHPVTSDGLPKYLSTVGGPYFVFYVAMNTTTLQQFMYCLEAAFNLLELGFLEKEHFISSLRFILRHKCHFEDEVIQFLRERVITIFDINDICLLLNDFGILATKVESLITVAPLDSSCITHFYYAIEAFCFFEHDEAVHDQIFGVLAYFIEFDPSYLYRIIPYIHALPHLEKKKILSIDDKSQYQKQLKLINLFFHHSEIVFSTFSNEELMTSMSRLNPTVGSEFLYTFSVNIVKFQDYNFSSALLKISAFLITISSFERTWVALFNLLTHQNEFVSIEEYESNITNIRIVHDEYIRVIFKLITDSFYESEYAYRALKFTVDIIHSCSLPMAVYFKAIQYLCSLGCGQKSLKVEVQQQQQAAVLPSPSPSLESMIGLSSKRRSSNFSQNSVQAKTKESGKGSFEKFLGFKQTSSFSSNADLASQSQSSHVHDFPVHEYFDPQLTVRLVNFLNARCISEEDVSDPQIPTYDGQKYANFESDITKLVINMVVEALIDCLDSDNIFETNLFCLTVQGSDVDEYVAIHFHQHAILELLTHEEIYEHEKCFEKLLLFLSYRIADDWWKGMVLSLFNTVLPHLKSGINFTYFIISVFTSSDNESNASTINSPIKDALVASSFFSQFQLISNEFSLFLRLTGENMSDSKCSQKIEEFKENAKRNNSNVKKERNDIAFPDLHAECVFLFKRQIIDSVHTRKVARYQFFWHLNSSSLFINKAISLIHLQRLKQKFTLGIPDKFMISTSSSPLCVPTKLMPCVFSYDNRCQKMSKLIDIPHSHHRSPYKSILPELTIEYTAPNCFEGWKMPIFVNIHFSEFAKDAFHGISAPFEAQMLGTPEACQCVVILNDKNITIILNCDLTGKTPPTENLCHYPLFEETMAGYFGRPAIFFNKPAFTVPLKQITMVVPRRYIHSSTAIDSFTITGIQISLVTSPANRKLLINHLKPKYSKTAKTGPLFAKKLLEKPVSDVAKKWMRESISSFQYLLYLNSIGNRSFNDYSQYPVFPWVASDYQCSNFPPPLRDLSKPLGQISGTRILKFERVFEETNNGYFYGTHYSYPAAVLHYMMRAEPFTIFNVVLHSGFDHRDRLFSSLFETWFTCSECNTTDLKELIPQFFCFPAMFENLNKLLLQTRSDGTDINRVRLPPWGPTPTIFIHRHRKILESKRLCKTLPSWIDLIFGYKQRGPAAVEAKNVFLPISYDSPNEEDEALTAADIDTILNFGQCPLQIMTSPHGTRSSQTYHNISNSFTRFCYVRNISKEIKELKEYKDFIKSSNLNADENYRVTVYDHQLMYSVNLTFKVGTLPLSVSERRISFNNQRLNHDTLIDIVDAVVSRDQTLLTIITTFGKIETYSLLYDKLDFVSSTCLPDIIPLIAVDVSSHFGLIVVASETHLAVVDLMTGFLLAKLHGEFNKVAFDETHDLIIASSAKTMQISAFSPKLNLIYQSSLKSSLKLSQQYDEILTISTTDSNHWEQSPYFVTGHKDGNILLWVLSTDGDRPYLRNKCLHKAEYSITSLVIFARGKAITYADSNGNIGIISCCQKNRRRLLKMNCYERCSICKESISKITSFCSVCGLPCCKICFGKSVCSKCAEYAAGNNGSYMLNTTY
ncbi:hypothetical protein TRFO_02298 [Tritrichomonas foetus]|uniref:BEACH domain-containing protein n=1 Tax=Tritrichomonas foetus TaxID=1144522 RepID=A0A1J4J6J4_9EUKA|nr:hypothetical protein TRFO_02298 [Tritrichomonas foetus]|eukprot:OHS93791.1 hypothetical protein TRFO_02298 [Tritrichomonas foetus]